MVDETPETPAETSGEETMSEAAAVSAGDETTNEGTAESAGQPAGVTGGDQAGEPVAAAPAPAGQATPRAAMTADEGSTGTGAGRPNRRKVREGLVVSVAMDKTAVIGVIERVRHPRYAKTVQRTKRLYADDPNNDLRVGDRVRLAETRPLSKLKRWRVVDVLERAR
jgi:small subunit ribosomal protein S17